jgi:signal transduction histidine kinase
MQPPPADPHTLWLRQVRRATAPDGGVDMALLGRLVSDAYGANDRAMRLSERAGMLASEELNEFAAKLKAERDASQAARLLAEEASRAKSAFLANMSHELRTPLNAIIGYSEIVKEDAECRGDDAAVWDMSRVLNAARHLLELISDILDMAKVEAGKIDLNPQFCDLDGLVGEVIATVKPQADANGNALYFDRAAILGAAHLDEKRLKQCLFNLLSNACKFTRNGHITFSVWRDGPALNFRVADTGAGIPAAKIGKLFEPFARAHGDVIEGTGLGLALTRRLSRMMGGDVSVISREGHGACFTLTIAAAALESSAAE